MNATTRTSDRADRLRAAGFLLGYAVLAALGRASSPDTTFALLWPAAGVAFAWMLWAPSLRHRLVAATGVATVWALAALPAQITLGPVLVGAVSHATMAMVTARLFAAFRRRTTDRREWLATPRHVFDLVVAALLGAAATAVPATAALAWNAGGWELDLLWAWVARNASGVVVVGAVVLLALDERVAPWEGARDRKPAAVRLELAAHVLASLALGWLVFGPGQQVPLSFGCLAGAAWAGYRFSPSTSAKASFVYGTGAAVATLLGWGPFGTLADQFEKAVVVQLFAASGTVLALLLSLGVREHRSIALRLARSEAGAREQSELFSAVAASMTDGVLVIDAGGRVVMSNRAADELLGRGKELGGVHEVSLGFQELDRSRITSETSLYSRALAGETVHGHPYLHVHPVTGRESVQSVSVAPLASGAAGDAGSVVVILHDVTAQQAQLAELQSFAGVVAHDLKSPLTSVVAWGELLQLDQDQTHQREGLQRILAAALRMDRLIDDLLDYTRTTARKLGAEELDLDHLVRTLADEIDSEFDRRVTVEHDGLGTVVADPTLTRQTLDNLLRNAAKYVAPGVDPHIHVTSRPVGDMVAVTVRDNGIGIPADARHRVFETFYRAAHSYPGTGLGLAICKRAVERHGGEILVEDDAIAGTAITFTLPAARATVAA